VRGRLFDDHDPPGHPIAIVNETLVRRCWPKDDPIGKRFGDGQPNHWLTVVGVIADIRQTSLADEPDAESYVPYAQSPDFTMAFVVRTTGDPLRLSGSIRDAFREVASDLPISGMAALTDNLDRSTRSRRFSATVLAAFALLALLLAALGIYGVISYSVTRRTQEIGVRMALGAAPLRIEWFVAGRALVLAGCGILLGWAGALALTRLLRSLLFGVSPTDPTVFVAASVFLLAAAALAGYLPARRAARTDPLIALRHE
jgi:putative ABC transport system permease protein